jgi:16S rRNA (adenine1518-N6/adenine1519-N6)-dimethyltransferase
LESKISPDQLVLTIQHEVAMRICAQSGKMSLLSLGVQVYGHPKIRAKIPAGAFYPIPKVDSAIVRVDIYPQPRISPQHINTFFQLARAGFQHKRKTLRNSLGAGLNLPGTKTEQLIKAAGIDPRSRAETLNIEEWESLVKVFETEL